MMTPLLVVVVVVVVVTVVVVVVAHYAIMRSPAALNDAPRRLRTLIPHTLLGRSEYIATVKRRNIAQVDFEDSCW